MPAKGSKLKSRREKGVNKTELKKTGYAHDPPIPYNQFGGDSKALRQFKANYKNEKKRKVLFKGLLKDLKSGRLYLADEAKERYVELTEEQYDSIVEELGERVGLDGGEPRIGKPFQGRTKDQEVIEPPAKKAVVEAKPEKPIPKKAYKEPANVSDAIITYANLESIKPSPDYLQSIVDQAEKVKSIDSDIDTDDDDDDEVNAIAITIFNKDYIMDNQYIIYEEKSPHEKVGRISLYESKTEIVLRYKGMAFTYSGEEVPITPEGSEAEEDEDEDRDDYESMSEVLWDNGVLKKGNVLVSNAKDFDGTQDSIKLITGRFIPSLDIRDDKDLFPELFVYRWRDVWWVLNQHIRDGEVINPDGDDEFSYEDEEDEEDEEDGEVLVVGIRAMRGRRRVLLVKPPRFRWEDDDNENTLYIYDAGKKYYEGNAELIGKENYGDEDNELSAAELTPRSQPEGLNDEDVIRYGYIEKGFEWFDKRNGGGGDEDGAYSEDEFYDFEGTKPLELSNPPDENDIEMKDANYIVALSEITNMVTTGDPPMRIIGGAGGYEDPLGEEEVWINKFKEFTTEGREREEIFNELVEEILSGEVDEILRAKILEEMGVIDSKKKPKMGSGKGKKVKITVKKEKKELSQAQFDALAAARAKRKAKREAATATLASEKKK